MLAIGLVVDDAIIVVENVNRHLEEGMKPMPARDPGRARAGRADHRHDRRADRRLCADRLPGRPDRRAVHRIRLHAGRRGDGLGRRRADAVADDGSRLLQAPAREVPRWEARLVGFIDARFDGLHRRYERWLHGSLTLSAGDHGVRADRPGQHLFPLCAARRANWRRRRTRASSSRSATSAPERDAAAAAALSTGRSTETSPSYPETDHVFQLDMPGQNHRRHGAEALGPARTRTTDELQPLVQQEMAAIAGAQVVAFQPPPLPGSQGLPIQFVIEHAPIRSTRLNDVAQKFLQDARAERHVHLPRHRSEDRPAADRRWRSTATRRRSSACKMSDVGSALGAMLGGGYVNYFSLDGRSYKVIPQVQQRFRLNADQLLNYYIRTANGASGAAVHRRAHHHHDGAAVAQPFPAAQLRDDPGRGRARRVAGDALCSSCRTSRRATLPPGYTVDYGGLSRQYVQESSGFAAHLRLRADHHLPGAGGAVRELPRSADHPGLGADVDRRRADLHQPRARRRQPQHLHRGRPGHADGPDQQARHPDRRVRQRAAAARPVEARGDRAGGRASACGRS